MKISSSSSLLFALAISSSSSSLAAPTGEPASSDGGLTSSPSVPDLVGPDSMAARNLRPSNMQESIEQARASNNDLEERGKLLDILGGLLCPLVTCPAPKENQALLAQPSGSTQETIRTLQRAIALLQSEDDGSDSPSTAPDSSRTDDGDDNLESGDDDAPTDDGEADGDDDGEPDGDDDDDDGAQAHLTMGDDSSSPSTVAAADYSPTTSSSSSLPSNPPNTPEMSSTSASAEPTGGVARRDALPVTPSDPVAQPVLPVRVAEPTLPVAGALPSLPVAGVLPSLPVAGVLPPLPVAGVLPSLPVPGQVTSNVGIVESTFNGVKEIVVGTANNVVRELGDAAQAPFPARRWMSRRQVPPQVPVQSAPVPTGAPGTATSVVLNFPSAASSKAGSTVPIPVSQNAGVVAGAVGGVPGTAEGHADPVITVGEGGVQMGAGAAKGAAPAPAVSAGNTVGGAAGGGVGTVSGVAGGSPAPAPAKGVASDGTGVAANVASNA